MTKTKFQSINGLRAISIMMVILSHLGSEKHNIYKDYYQIKWLNPFIYFITDGGLGVNVFFVISGFLITSLMIAEETRTGDVSLKQFYIRRTLRIFPGYFFLLFIYACLQYYGLVIISNASWLTAITYTKYLNWSQDQYTCHAWSLSIEEQFYLFWPLIFIIGNKTRKWVCRYLILIVPVIKTFIFFYPISWIGELTIFYKIDAISIGCFCAIYKKNILNLMSNRWNLFLYPSIVGILLLRFIPLIALKYNLNLNLFFIPFGKTGGTISDIFIAVITMYSIFYTKSIWFKLLNTKLLNFIGILSYSLYLWQQLLIFVPFFDKLYPLNILFIPIAAILSFYIIEKPFLKLKARFN